MIEFYDIDPNYTEFLQRYDTKAPNIRYDSNNKFVCGVILEVNNTKYFAPVSHMTTHQRTNMLIYDRNTPIASIRFSFMFPAIESVIIRKDFSDIALRNPDYARLLRKEYTFCLRNTNRIMRKANQIYRKVCSGNSWFKSVCCDFQILEQHYMDYLTL